MNKLIFSLALALILIPLHSFAEEGESGKLYLDESYFDSATGYFHIVISLAAATQFMQDLVAGEAKVNYISLPEPRKKDSSAEPVVQNKNTAMPTMEEITGYSREEMEGMYDYAGPEVVDAMLQERGFPSFRDVMDAYDLLSGNEAADDTESVNEEARPVGGAP
jgi:hypothetical protein